MSLTTTRYPSEHHCRDTIMPLTADGLRTMVRLISAGLNHSFTPLLLQVISVQVRGLKNNGVPRYCAVLSDGSHFVEAHLSTRLNEMVESDELRNNAIICAEEFTSVLSEGANTIFLFNVSLVSYRRNRIGSPTDIETADALISRTRTVPAVISDNDRERERGQKRAREYTHMDLVGERAVRQRREAEQREEARLLREEKARATTLEVKLVEKLTQEKESIGKLETNLEAMKDHISTMKRSLKESIEALPPAQRPFWNLREAQPRERQEQPQCVICHEKAPERAVVPCGHLCLCHECAPSISHGQPSHRFCPLCRGPVSSTLRIYL